MSSLLTEETSKGPIIYSKEEVMNIIIAKCKRILSPLSEYDLLFSKFLKSETDKVTGFIAEHKENKEGELELIEAYHFYTGLNEKMERLEKISSKWSSLVVRQRMLCYGLVDEYDEIRAEIDEMFTQIAESGDYGDYLNKEALKDIKMRKSREEKRLKKVSSSKKYVKAK